MSIINRPEVSISEPIKNHSEIFLFRKWQIVSKEISRMMKFEYECNLNIHIRLLGWI